MSQLNGLLIAAGNATTNPDPNTMGPTFTAATTDIVTSSVAHGLTVGDPVFVSNSGGALPTGLSAATRYFAGPLDATTAMTSTTFKLYATYAAALAGTSAVDITGTGSGTHTMAPILIINNQQPYRNVAEAGWAALTAAGTYCQVLVPRGVTKDTQVPLMVRFEPVSAETVTYTVTTWRYARSYGENGTGTRPWAKPADTPTYNFTGSAVVDIQQPGVTPWFFQLSSISTGNIRIFYDNGVAESV
jgi:hypothetical protein